jgi:hydroxyethylthiazole kinase-like sugar kinase family protein
MKISVDTRDRLRRVGASGDSLEDVVVAALDSYETSQFWAEAEAAAASETAAQAADRKRVEADADAWMDALR